MGSDTIDETIPRIRNSVDIIGLLNKRHFVLLFLLLDCNVAE